MEKEYGTLICRFLLIVLFIVVPVFQTGSYYEIGDTKYEIFRNLTAVCIIPAILALLLCPDNRCRHKYKGSLRIGLMDGLMIALGLWTLVSAMFSEYGDTAWFGYREWHMGAFTTLLLLGIYFCISRSYQQSDILTIVLGVGFFLICAAGIYQKLGGNPFGILENINSGDWEYSHMLSTIGNINWFCGYMAVGMVFPMAMFMESTAWGRILFGGIMVFAGMCILWLQGSDSGIVLLFLEILLCLLAGIVYDRRDGRIFFLLSAFCASSPIYSFLADKIGLRAQKTMPADGIPMELRGSMVWYVLAFVLFIMALVMQTAGHGESRNRTCAVRRYLPDVGTVYRICVLSGMIMAMIFLCIYVGRKPAEQSPDSGRVVLWKASIVAYGRGSFKDQLLGAGPDCYGEYLYSHLNPEEVPEQEGRWQGSVYANAHNEFLTQLIDLGIVGFLVMTAIFTTSLIRYRKCFWVWSGILGYLMIAMTGFAQCISTPCLYALIGIGEAERKKRIEKGKQEDA